jgi:ribonuclease HII
LGAQKSLPGLSRPEAGQNPEIWHLMQGSRHVAGVDEAGRGPLAGPVVAAAVVLPPAEKAFPGLRDSKKLSPAQRTALEPVIRAQAAAFAVVEVGVEDIEGRGILHASLQAMARAVGALAVQPDVVLVDGPWQLPLELPQHPLVEGDARCLAIAAASILAKVHRDQRMLEYHCLYPQYNFARHKGYGTAEHLAALRRWGPCPIHRRTFRGVKEFFPEGHERT